MASATSGPSAMIDGTSWRSNGGIAVDPRLEPARRTGARGLRVNALSAPLVSTSQPLGALGDGNRPGSIGNVPMGRGRKAPPRLENLDRNATVYRGNSVVRRQVGQLDAPAGKEGAAADQERVGRSRPSVVKATTIAPLALALKTWTCSAMTPAAVSTSRKLEAAIVASVGLRSKATRVAVGTSSRRTSSRFAANSAEKKLTPVALPPGRERLVTRPSLTGSSA